jgi:AcrR family transcriptional regulator
VTIREVARESGYSAGVLAHYFKNKDDLLVHTLRLSHKQILKRYEAETQTPVHADALRAILFDNLPLEYQRELETRIEMSFWARSLRNEALCQIQHEEARYHRDLYRRLIEGCQEEGTIAEAFDCEMIVDLLATLIDGISLHALLYPERLPPTRQRAIMEFVLERLEDEASS